MRFTDTPEAAAQTRSPILAENRRLIRKCNALVIVVVVTYLGLALAGSLWALAQYV